MEGMSGANDFMMVLEKVSANGIMVKAGEVVAEFDRQYQLQRLDDYKASVEQSERSMTRVDAELEVTRKARDQARRQAEAYIETAKLDLKTSPVLSRINQEQMKLNMEEAEAQLRMVKSQMPYADISDKASRRNSEMDVANSKVELQRAEKNVDQLIRKAPMDGMVVLQTMRRGSEMVQIQKGDQLFPGLMFMQIVDPSSLVVNATINQTDVDMVRYGAKATLRFDAYPDLTLPAHVIRIGAMTNSAGSREKYMREVAVVLKIDRLDPRIIPDLSVSADVVVEEAQNQTLVPLESIFSDSATRSNYVYVKDGERFVRRTVRLGLMNNVKAGVVEGLRPGEVVAAEEPQRVTATAAAEKSKT